MSFLSLSPPPLFPRSFSLVPSPLLNASRLFPRGLILLETFQGKRIMLEQHDFFLEKVHSHLIKLIIVLQNPLWSFLVDIGGDK